MKVRSALVSVVVLATGSLGALVQVPASADAGGSGPDPARYLSSSAARHSTHKATMDRILRLLPKDWQQRRDARRRQVGLDESPGQEILRGKIAQAAAATRDKAIDPTKYQCAPTPFDGYVDSILADVDPDVLFDLLLLGALDVPAYDALLFGTPGDPAYALPAAYRDRLGGELKKIKQFWDVDLSDVSLVAMTGRVFGDVHRVARTIQFLYGVGPVQATEIAQLIIDLIDSEPALQGGRNPIFTLNAFAFSGEDETDPVLSVIEDKVVYGDGLLTALRAIGLGAIGPEAVLSHEMAHHVQYEDDLIGRRYTPEVTRRQELEADGFGSYFVAHRRGLHATPALIEETGRAFYDVGDCQFDSPGHHGTPNQRRAASAWGVSEVAYAKNPAKVIPSLRLDAEFREVLPVILRPDAATSYRAYRAG